MIDTMADALPISSYLGSSLPIQILSALAIIVALYMGFVVLEYIYNSFTNMWSSRVELFPNTYASNGKVRTAVQDPSIGNALTVPMSSNQLSGIEFSYSMFVNISSATFASGDQQLWHILHKGYSQFYPLLGPGIFCWGHNNTLRVYMNCYDTWNNFTDVPNIPVDKWFHLVVSCKGNILYVHINGNLSNKQNLSASTPPYQNYGNVYLFSSRTMTLNCNKTPSTAFQADGVVDSIVYPSDTNASPPASASCAYNEYTRNSSQTPLSFAGAAQGMASRVFYYSYALTSTEITALMNMGPSSVMDGADMTISPYLADTWWTDHQTSP